MATTLNVPVEDVNTQMATFDELRVYHDTVPDGTFTSQVSGSPTDLVQDQTSYEVSDSTGVPGRWYRSRLFHSVNLDQTELSEPWQARGLSMRTARLEAGIFCGRATYGTCSSLGTATSLVDETLLDQGIDAKFAEGAWVLRPDAADAGDLLRRTSLNPFNLTTGALAPVRPWADPPAEGEVYEVYTLVPPLDQPGAAYSWNRAVRDALAEIYYIDQLVLGVGTATRDKQFSLSPFLFSLRREDIRHVYLRTFDNNGVPHDVDASKQLRYWDFISNGDDDQSIRLSIPPRPTDTIIAEVNRPYPAIYRDSDVTSCNLDLLAPATAMKLFEHLSLLSGGKYQSEWAMCRAAFLSRYSGQVPDQSVVGTG
jgi:hypothetical protein